MLELVGLFFLGFAVDVGWVAYVHLAGENRAVTAGFVSMGLVAGSLMGFGESIKSVAAAAAYVIGHGLGTMVAVALKRRTSRVRSSSSA